MAEKSRLLVLVLSLTGFVTSFGAYVVAAAVRKIGSFFNGGKKR